MKILRLELLAHNLDVQAKFYGDKLGLPVAEFTSDSVSFKTGISELVFTRADPKWKGFYNLAFNIPDVHFEKSHAWLEENLNLVLNKDWKDIFIFKAWNARASYCLDPENNIIEFVSRRSNNHIDQPGDGYAKITCISEIGIVTDNVPDFARNLIDKLGLRAYHNTLNESFAALGDDHGLVLVARTGREWYPNNGKIAQFAPIKAIVEIEGGQHEIHTVFKKDFWGTTKQYFEIK